MTSFCQLWLTCADKTEADKIAQGLLEKKLIACAKQLPLTADFFWQGKIENAKEVLLVMESTEKFFEKVESEVEKLHSYDTFVLQAIPMTRVSKSAEVWLNESLKGG